ncbi:pyridoxamine 5-phosphate oxidase [Rhodobacterales bacterium HKCCE2091]|nr:pyridoxamine 5-phosphate oxidase [Rhodobacterales bacterium HKCCE2091]
MQPEDPFRETDDEARNLARSLLAAARHGALGVIDPASGRPSVTRVALAPHDRGAVLTLVSTLAPHTAALSAHPPCSILIGEPGPKGDPLTHPRLTIAADAEEADKSALKAHYLSANPKAGLYYDFADFRMFRLVPVSALLNGGFGRAYRLTADDLSA